MKKLLTRDRLDRVEISYLLALRIAGLLIATLCLAAALFFAGDAIWRLAVSTQVKAEPTVVDAAVLSNRLATPPKPENADDVPDAARAAHDRFARSVWPRYYAHYKTAFDKYRKTDDELAPSKELMDGLGYSLDDYLLALDGEHSAGDRVLRFVNDSGYQTAAIAKVGEVMASPRVVQLLAQYRTAEKSERRCITTPETRTIPRTCGYYYVYDCSFTRTVDVERCEAVYPDGVVSPIQAFERADWLFSDAYFTDEAAKRHAADQKLAERLETRAKIGPLLRLSFVILGGFFAVMFLFLIIAIERHLRRLSVQTAA